jgi:hypothetical protein
LSITAALDDFCGVFGCHKSVGLVVVKKRRQPRLRRGWRPLLILVLYAAACGGRLAFPTKFKKLRRKYLTFKD